MAVIPDQGAELQHLASLLSSNRTRCETNEQGNPSTYPQQADGNFRGPEVSQDTYKEVSIHVQGEGEAEQLAHGEHHNGEKLRPLRPREGGKQTRP